jgi:hypothetical protein
MLSGPEVYLDLYLISRRGARPKPAAQEFAASIEAAAVKLAK